MAPSSQLPAPSSQLPAPSSQLPAPSSQLPAPSSQLSRIPVGSKSDPRGGGCLQVLRNLALTVQLDVPHLAHPDAEPAIESELGRHEHLYPAARSRCHARERE